MNSNSEPPLPKIVIRPADLARSMESIGERNGPFPEDVGLYRPKNALQMMDRFRNTSFLLIPLFALTLLGGWWLVSTWWNRDGRMSGKAAIAVERVLRTDKNLTGQTLGHLPKGAEPPALRRAIEQYVTQAKAQPFSDCPADFVVSYRHHLHAWKEFEEVVAEIPASIWEVLLVGFANGLFRQELDGGHGRMEARYNTARAKIHSTWQETERIAAKYGVALLN